MREAINQGVGLAPESHSFGRGGRRVATSRLVHWCWRYWQLAGWGRWSRKRQARAAVASEARG